MRRTFLLFSFVLVLLVVADVSAADEGRWLGEVKVRYVTGQTQTVYKSMLTDSTLVGLVPPGDTITIENKYIESILRRNGTQARKGGAIGLAIGAAVGFGVSMASKDDGFGDDNTGVIIYPVLGFGALGGIAGAVIGSFSDSWESIPITANAQYDPAAGETKIVLSLSF